jgi:hypothetical protein
MANRNQILQDHAEILIDLLYGRPILNDEVNEDVEEYDLAFTQPFVEKLARYPHAYTLSWTYEERLEALTDMFLSDLDPEYFYRPSWQWNLVRPRPFQLVKKLQQMFPRRDATHLSNPHDMITDSKGGEDEDGEQGVGVLNQPLVMIEGVAQPFSLDQGDERGAFNLTPELVDCIGKSHIETLSLLAQYGSPQAAAKVLGVKEGTFRQRLFRARRAAKACMGIEQGM